MGYSSQYAQDSLAKHGGSDGSKDKKVARNEKRMEKSESKDKPVRRRKKLRENRPTNKF